jgi:dTMP kinase
MTTRGRFITLEGVDGAGKSTHIEFIADEVRAQGHHVIVTREPGGTDLAEKLRREILNEPMSATAETLLVFAARADHVERVIRPTIQSSHWVVCDRFTDATIAYQGAGKGVPRDLIDRLGEAAHGGIRPDRTLVFDCPYEVARQRLAATGKALDRFESEARDFFERVRGAYLELARAEPDRVRVIDASQDIPTIEKLISANLKF